jgi:ureidoacrylate peracid hydrolase
MNALPLPSLERAAVVVVDMQHAFCDRDGCVARSGLDHRDAAAAIEPCARLASAARAAGRPLVLTRYALAADHADAGLLFEVAPRLRLPQALVAGSWDAALVGELAPRPGDVVLDKTRYSAFFATDLHAQLQARGVDTVVICGVTTNVCVEGTARDAFAHDYRVVVCSDATAAVTRELHDAALRSISYGLGTVAATGDVLRALSNLDQEKVA